MPIPLVDILMALPVFALVLFRLGGLFLAAPVLGSTTIPTRIKAAMVFTLGAMVFPLVRAQAPEQLTLAGALCGGVGEVLIGLSIGLGMAMILAGAEVCGLLVGQQAGIALGQVFNPAQNSSTTTVSQLYSIVLIMVFLVLGGHRAMVQAVLETFDVLPMLSMRFDGSLLLLLVEMLTAAFVMAIRLAGPVLIAMFLTTLAMGLLSRTMPQLNILTVGFQVRILVSLAVAGITIGVAQDLLVDVVWEGLGAVRECFHLDPIPGQGA